RTAAVPSLPSRRRSSHFAWYRRKAGPEAGRPGSPRHGRALALSRAAACHRPGVRPADRRWSSPGGRDRGDLGPTTGLSADQSHVGRVAGVQILPRLVLKCLLTARGAEIVGLPVVLGGV